MTQAASGGVDAFAAQVSEDLSPSSSDAIAYYGGSGTDRATSLSVANGQVWIGGQAGTDLPGQPAVGTKDGFIAQLDIAGGQIVTSNRFTGKDGMAAPTDDRPVNTDRLQRARPPRPAVRAPSAPPTLATAERPELAARRRPVHRGGRRLGPPVTITIDPGETLDTLATRRSSAPAAIEATATDGTQPSPAVTSSCPSPRPTPRTTIVTSARAVRPQ